MINSLCLQGVCGMDSKMNATQTGLSILSFSIAYSESKKDQQGNWVNGPAQWWSCKVFGKYADALWSSGKSPKKGERVVVTGAVQLREYTDKQGAPRTSHEILVDQMVVIPKMANSTVQPDAQITTQPAPQQAQQPEFTDDLPY